MGAGISSPSRRPSASAGVRHMPEQNELPLTTAEPMTSPTARSPAMIPTATATPAPNDHMELGTHAEFLGIMKREEMLAAFFVHDDTGWRLKGHAREPFYRWLASWAMSLKRPSDLGYSDDGYALPPLEITASLVPTTFSRPASCSPRRSRALATGLRCAARR